MKRGISPLISVILLIGLTVTVIAFIATWVNNLQKTTEEFAATQQEVLSASNFKFEVTDVVKTPNSLGGGNYKDITITIANGEYTIEKLVVVEYNGNEKEGTTEMPVSINPYETKSVKIPLPIKISAVELIPKIKINNKELLIPNAALKIKILE